MRTSLGVVLGLALLGAACGQRSREQSANREVPREAYVRVVNAMPDGTAIDVFADNQKLFPEIKPGAVVAYREVSPGLITFRARWTVVRRTLQWPIIERFLEMENSRRYSCDPPPVVEKST